MGTEMQLIRAACFSCFRLTFLFLMSVYVHHSSNSRAVHLILVTQMVLQYAFLLAIPESKRWLALQISIG